MEAGLVFLGEYKTRFTGKGRIILPKKLRQEIKGKVVVLSRGFEGCIWGFDLKSFEKHAHKQLEISATEERARILRRYLFSGSESVELDSQGRFVVPSALLTYANILDEVVIIGVGDYFEIWNASIWDKQIKQIEEEYGR